VDRPWCAGLDWLCSRVAGSGANTAAELVRSFAAIMTQPHGHRLGDWLTRAKQANLPGINRFGR
jgi:hypothetical protein